MYPLDSFTRARSIVATCTDHPPQRKDTFARRYSVPSHVRSKRNPRPDARTSDICMYFESRPYHCGCGWRRDALNAKQSSRNSHVCQNRRRTRRIKQGEHPFPQEKTTNKYSFKPAEHITTRSFRRQTERRNHYHEIFCKNDQDYLTRWSLPSATENQSNLSRSSGELDGSLPPYPRSVCDTRNLTTHARTAGFDAPPHPPPPIYVTNTQFKRSKQGRHAFESPHPSISEDAGTTTTLHGAPLVTCRPKRGLNTQPPLLHPFVRTRGHTNNAPLAVDQKRGLQYASITVSFRKDEGAQTTLHHCQRSISLPPTENSELAPPSNQWASKNTTNNNLRRIRGEGIYNSSITPNITQLLTGKHRSPSLRQRAEPRRAEGIMVRGCAGLALVFHP